jgi:hypothetical protein
VKRLRAPALVTFLSCASFAIALENDAPPVAVSLDRTGAQVGDAVVATYTARIPPRGSLELESLVTPAPAGTEAPPAGGVLDYTKPAPPKVTTAPDGSTVWTVAVRFSPFAPGDLTVPGPHFVYVAPSGERTAVRGASARLHVDSRLPKGQKPEALAPKSARPARIPAHGALFWTSLAAAAVALAALVAWIVRRLRAKTPAAAVAAPALPPSAELLAELTRLEAVAETLGEDPRGFYTDLTHATKRYLERRLDLPILEWTTFETVRRLRDRNLEPPREIGLAELLGAADRVKFGKGHATREEAKTHLARARRLCEHLEALLAPKPPAPAAEGAAERRTAS